jgi:hypothetical protein
MKPKDKMREKAQEKAKAEVARRDFLRVLGAGDASTGAAPLAGAAKADTESSDEKRKARYRETADVKAFYRVNRYPSK